jgi:hypothetical protein
VPFHLNIPLPGPFSYSARLGGRRRRRGGGSASTGLYWLVIGWWLVPLWLLMKWTVLGTIWLFVYAYSMVRGNFRPPRIANGRITTGG